MRRFARLAAAVASAAALAVAGSGMAAAAGAQPAVRPGKVFPRWTPISADIGIGFASAGLLRTADGRLHVVWPSADNGSYSLHYSTVAGRARLLNTGTVLGRWRAVDQFPRLVPLPGGGAGGGAMRLIFDGSNGRRGSPYNVGTFYSATSSQAGTAWTVLPGSLSRSHVLPLTDDTATAQPDGDPVTAWATGASLSYHVGASRTVPARARDIQIPIGPLGRLQDPTLATTSSGTVWGAWFNSSGTATMGYWVDRILQGRRTMRKAPGSGGAGLDNSQPLQSVAFALRHGGNGGEFLAYCVPTRTVSCGHVALWKVGTKKAMIVPGSASGQDGKVALAAAPDGSLWVAWFDFRAREIGAVRTNAAVTRFGRVLSIAPPPHLATFQSLQADAGDGPLDLVALAQRSAGFSPAFFAARVPATET